MTDQYRILIPSEYEALREAIPKSKHRIIIDLLLFSGMRYSETLYFSKHLSTFDAKNRAISLPTEGTKTKRERVVHLTPAFTKELDMYLREYKKLDVPTIRGMRENLQRWGTGITPKSFRKTWESWLLAAGYLSMAVALSQGHSELISYGHYANLDPRLKSEMDVVRKYTDGWGT